MISIRAATRHGLAAALALAATLGLAGGAARAQIGSDHYAAIVVDARTGGALYAASADEQRHPASLTKMMTLYMVFEALREGRLSLSTPLPVSPHAAARPPSRLGLAAGQTLIVEQAILALVTKSANDAAATVGEYLAGGSEARFGQMMTLRARALGMTRTTFRNASGLPDPDQVTTARDMALLGRRLMHDFPERFAYFSEPAFTYRGRTLWNHNRLLQEYEGTDGIKTGYVNDSGFNLVASAQRDGVRLIAAVFGGSTGRERDRHMMALLDQGFERMGVAPRGITGTNSLIAGRMPSTLGAVRAATVATFAGRGQSRSLLRAVVATDRRTTATSREAATTPARRAAAHFRRSRGGVERAVAPTATQRRGAARAAAAGRQIEQGDRGGRVTLAPRATGRGPAAGRAVRHDGRGARNTGSRRGHRG
jgi:D-alanyl-D-alanine carboxypeptidase